MPKVLTQLTFHVIWKNQQRNLTPRPPSLRGNGENLKPLSLQERGLERGSRDPVKSKIDSKALTYRVQGGFHQKSPRPQVAHQQCSVISVR